MMRDAVKPTPPAEGRLSRAELFNELARMHKRSSLRPGLTAGEIKPSQGHWALELRSPKIPARIAGKIPIGA
jgi:hypothetical protein